MPSPAPEFLSGGEVLPERGWHMPPHSHQVHELIVILDGRMRLEIDGQTFDVEAGDLLLYRAGHVHKETSDDAAPVNTFFLVFKAPEPALEHFALQLRDTDGRVRQMAAWLVRDHQAGVAPERQTPLLRALLTETRRLCGTPVDPWLADLRRHLQRQLTGRVCLEDLARHCGMSKFALVRKYRRFSGTTPMRDLQRMRLNQARTLMLTTGLPVKAIAPAVGLGDEYQLSKLFRRHFRLSPREMRARLHRRRRS
ncbi:MAG: AraC family transcriptional regulator [Opitutaceae bacterium]|nr:AraC family transcriptional regulator [Opitutaceae bacterium]